MKKIEKQTIMHRISLPTKQTNQSPMTHIIRILLLWKQISTISEIIRKLLENISKNIREIIKGVSKKQMSRISKMIKGVSVEYQRISNVFI